MSHITAPDTLTTMLADALAERIDYTHLARCIADAMRQQAEQEYDPEALIEADAIRRILGQHKRKKTISYPTFQRNYIDTGLLTYVEGPNRAKRYIRRAQWESVSTQTPKK